MKYYRGELNFTPPHYQILIWSTLFLQNANIVSANFDIIEIAKNKLNDLLEDLHPVVKENEASLNVFGLFTVEYSMDHYAKVNKTLAAKVKRQNYNIKSKTFNADMTMNYKMDGEISADMVIKVNGKVSEAKLIKAKYTMKPGGADRTITSEVRVGNVLTNKSLIVLRFFNKTTIMRLRLKHQIANNGRLNPTFHIIYTMPLNTASKKCFTFESGCDLQGELQSLLATKLKTPPTYNVVLKIDESATTTFSIKDKASAKIIISAVFKKVKKQIDHKEYDFYNFNLKYKTTWFDTSLSSGDKINYDITFPTISYLTGDFIDVLKSHFKKLLRLKENITNFFGNDTRYNGDLDKVIKDVVTVVIYFDKVQPHLEKNKDLISLPALLSSTGLAFDKTSKSLIENEMKQSSDYNLEEDVGDLNEKLLKDACVNYIGKVSSWSTKIRAYITKYVEFMDSPKDVEDFREKLRKSIQVEE